MYNDVYGRGRAGETELSVAASWRDRLIEIYPGFLSWLVLLAPIWLTLIHPVAGTMFVGLAIAIFLVRAGGYGVLAMLNRRLLLEAMERDYLTMLEAFPDWRTYRVQFLIRAFREGNQEMLRATLESIYGNRWRRDGKRMTDVEVIFATEIDDPITPPIVDQLAKEYDGRLKVRQIVHPVEKDVLPGPSSAMHYAGRVMYDEVLKAGEDPSKVIVVDLDADTLLHHNYLPVLMHRFMSDPQRDCRVFQPVVLFTTDYWHAPLHSRLAALGTSVLTVGWNRHPEIAFTGAAGTLALYHSVDFWPTLSHSQDSGIELKLRMRYRGKFDVVGIPVPAYVYPVMRLGDRSTMGDRLRSYAKSFRTLFRQSARWREGPMDEFIEAVKQADLYFVTMKLWSGLERDTLTLLPGYGFIAAKFVIDFAYPGQVVGYLQPVQGVLLTIVTLLGLSVFWQMLSTPQLVHPAASVPRRILEIVLFWLTFSIYVPIVTACAGLKTSTAYAFGRKPSGHYVPTPK